MAGNFNSGRWKNHTRRATVEECQRRTARSCVVCGRRCLCEYRYEPPRFATGIPAPATLQSAGVWACRRCHGLTYASIQLRKSGALGLLFEPDKRVQACSLAAQSMSDELQRAPFGLRDESIINRALGTFAAMIKAERYRYRSREYKPRAPK